MTNERTTTIALRHATHGTYIADPVILERAISATKHRSLHMLRAQAAGCCGFPEYDWMAGAEGPLDDLSRIEVLIAWIDSGNHTF